MYSFERISGNDKVDEMLRMGSLDREEIKDWMKLLEESRRDQDKDDAIRLLKEFKAKIGDMEEREVHAWAALGMLGRFHNTVDAHGLKDMYLAARDVLHAVLEVAGKEGGDDVMSENEGDEE